VAVETNVVGDACVFFHPAHGCSLQKAAIERGRHEWEFKPRFCIMFPLVVSEGVLTVDEEMDEVWCLKDENRTHRSSTRWGRKWTTSSPRKSFAG